MRIRFSDSAAAQRHGHGGVRPTKGSGRNTSSPVKGAYPRCRHVESLQNLGKDLDVETLKGNAELTNGP